MYTAFSRIMCIDIYIRTSTCLTSYLPFCSDGPTAQSWCENTTCPAASAATADNCCVHHVNVHSCPKARTSFCGPWIPDDGQVFTHSEVLVGPVQKGNWTSYVPGFYESGLTSVIAHFKVADMHYALEIEINVIPKSGLLINKRSTKYAYISNIIRKAVSSHILILPKHFIILVELKIIFIMIQNLLCTTFLMLRFAARLKS